MAHRMGSDVLAHTGGLAGTLADFLYARGGNGPVEVCAREEKVSRPNCFPISSEHFQQPRREHHVTILSALAVADADHHAAAVDVGNPKLGDFGNAQAGGIGGHKDGAMLDISDGCKEASHFVRTEDDRKSARLFDRRDCLRDVVATQGDTVQESQGGTSLFIVAEGDTQFLHEVEQEGADVFGAEVLR